MVTITTVSGALTRTLQVPEGTTVGSLRGNEGYRSYIGIPESSTVLVNGRTVSDTYAVREGDELVFEKQACQKA